MAVIRGADRLGRRERHEETVVVDTPPPAPRAGVHFFEETPLIQRARLQREQAQREAAQARREAADAVHVAPCPACHFYEESALVRRARLQRARQQAAGAGGVAQHRRDVEAVLVGDTPSSSSSVAIADARAPANEQQQPQLVRAPAAAAGHPTAAAEARQPSAGLSGATSLRFDATPVQRCGSLGGAGGPGSEPPPMPSAQRLGIDEWIQSSAVPSAWGDAPSPRSAAARQARRNAKDAKRAQRDAEAKALAQRQLRAVISATLGPRAGRLLH
jgi:hypothetical protein